MKNFTQIIFIFLFIIANSFAQQEKGIVGETNWLNNWTEFKPNQQDYGEPSKILAGNITENTTLYKREVYLLLGSVFVTDSITLTIEPGTVILGDFKTKGSLTISKDASIIANGTETDPIIFSSNRTVKRPGDWGGLVILGNAPINKFGFGSAAMFYPNLKASDYVHANYGGNDPNRSSGVIKHTRIEFAGKRISENRYFSGLLLASVGNETELSNIMVSHSAGNAFEVWGGNTTLNKLVSYSTHGNDFKFNYGTRAVLSNSLAVRSPYASNGGGSKCLEVKSYDRKEEFDFTKSGTLVKVQNITFINNSENLESDIKMNLVQEAVFIGKNASLDMNKSVISGFNPAVVLDENIIINQENLEKINFNAMLFNNCNGNIFVEYNSNNEDLENWYGNSVFFNVYSKSDNYETFIDTKNARRPDFRLRINKIIASNEVDPDLRSMD
ncbi:hypothetical protein DIS18_09900 [Algibacter marinivivus]|uniref:T9SS C-terminal target domain-containing protein n=1 Tax=Algibacter marinivivus TaxID=2100723 RepID=A0A2U2X458_9FLAO|nr:hypothetical protein [Algibacter marinivivus]PWH82549.1 hypothetical protein DIS18_09900 [Algibacter marinivivus]